MEENDGNMVRFRLIFDDRHLLDKALRSQGLRRCWFLLKPSISTFGELTSHIRESFGLHDRIVLFIDDFALPSFESTSIITDKDIITVKKKEAKKKNICKPCDGQRLTRDSQIASIHDLPFNNDLLSDDKSQKNSQGSGSYDKEKMISCTGTAVHLDPDVDLVKRKRKHSKQLLGSNSQSEENNHDHEFERSNSSDVLKKDSYKKQASTQIIHHSSDGEEGVAPFAVQSGFIRIQPREYETQQVDETQPLFDGGSSMNKPITNKEKNFPQTTDNDRCIKIDEVPLGDGLLPLPNPTAMPSTNNITGPHKQLVHFESLLPLRRLPVKGDVLVYRFAEPSSSSQPELSYPQVGRVLSFDYNTLQIKLHPLLDYEILLENPNGAVVQQNSSRGKEDELIEIKYYSSLIDVRLLKIHDSEESACQKDSAMKDNWEEALAKESENELNVLPAEQSNGWSQWTPNKSSTLTSLSYKQSNTPIPGRNNGKTNWHPNRNMNPRPPNNIGNRNFNMYPTNWDLNRSTASGNTLTTLPWSYRVTGLPTPWNPHQNQSFPQGGKYHTSGKQ